jgi:hypothetical protein
MKRVLFLTTALVLLVALGAVVLAELPAKPGPPADVVALLNQYLAYAYQPGAVSVRAIDQASQPGNLSRDLGYEVFGASVIYQTDIGAPGYEEGGTRPLPYPPEQVWCVLLERDGTYGPHPENVYDVVFVALHMDLHNADLMVHKGSQHLSASEARGVMGAMGCEGQSD